MYIYYKIYKSMRRGRIHGEKNMRNSRTKTQTKLRNYIKLTAGALLLAITFVLVFAGTLSGAFGIENELQQNGTIESNVASAAIASVGQANINGEIVKLENNHNNTSGVKFLLSQSDFYTSSTNSMFSTPSTSDRGWGYDVSASNGDKRSFLIKLPLSNEIISALNNDIEISVKFEAIRRGSGNADWATIGIYSSVPTSYPSIGSHQTGVWPFRTDHYYWNWSTKPDYAIAMEKGTGSGEEWSHSDPTSLSCSGIILQQAKRFI